MQALFSGGTARRCCDSESREEGKTSSRGGGDSALDLEAHEAGRELVRGKPEGGAEGIQRAVAGGNGCFDGIPLCGRVVGSRLGVKEIQLAWL